MRWMIQYTVALIHISWCWYCQLLVVLPNIIGHCDIHNDIYWYGLRIKMMKLMYSMCFASFLVIGVRFDQHKFINTILAPVFHIVLFGIVYLWEKIGTYCIKTLPLYNIVMLFETKIFIRMYKFGLKWNFHQICFSVFRVRLTLILKQDNVLKGTTVMMKHHIT